jgi:hypothetical protein
MSQENVETMRAVIEAFNRREGTEFGAFLADDAEIVPIRAAVEGTTYRGDTPLFPIAQPWNKPGRG